MNDALQHNESQAAEASAVSTELKPGVTIDLSRKNIQELPEEVVDIIKNELERLVTSRTWTSCKNVELIVLSSPSRQGWLCLTTS